MKTILKVEGLTKSFGTIKAVSNLSFSVSEGQVLSLLGPNGSGKTTTLNLLLQTKYPDSGTFHWFDGQRGPSANRNIGTLIEVPHFFPYLNLEKNLRIVAHARGKGLNDIQRTLELVGLTGRIKSSFYTLSFGMKQRLALASALLGNPDVLILDEPANGLDPEGIAEVREIILQQRDLGKTIIMASHLLDEVEKVCTDVVILKNGERIAYGKVDELLGGKTLVTISAENIAELQECLKTNSRISILEMEGNSIRISLSEGLTTTELNKWLVEKGIIISTLELHKASLESQFLELVKGPSQHD